MCAALPGEQGHAFKSPVSSAMIISSKTAKLVAGTDGQRISATVKPLLSSRVLKSVAVAASWRNTEGILPCGCVASLILVRTVDELSCGLRSLSLLVTIAVLETKPISVGCTVIMI